MIPVAGIAGALTSVVGGIFESGAIARRAAQRARLMELQALSAIGEAKARAGASGVEMSSSTVQLHLTKMREQYDLAKQTIAEASDDAMRNTWMQTMGSFASSMGGALSGTGGGGSDPFGGGFQGMPETSPGVKVPDFEWVQPDQPKFPQPKWEF